MRGELEEAVPGTFQVLSRLGNVTNSHYRLQTTLQSCLRVHELATSMKSKPGGIVWHNVGVQATIGMSTAEANKVDKLCIFVKNWSGGDKGDILRELTIFEKTLHHKRFIRAEDLAALGECDHQYPRIVPVCSYIWCELYIGLELVCKTSRKIIACIARTIHMASSSIGLCGLGACLI